MTYKDWSTTHKDIASGWLPFWVYKLRLYSAAICCCQNSTHFDMLRISCVQHVVIYNKVHVRQIHRSRSLHCIHVRIISGGATILRVGGTNITASEASRKFVGAYPPHVPFSGVQQLQREACGEPIGQRCYNILLVVLVH